MAIKKEEYLSEVLLRFNESGFKAAHQAKEQRVFDDESGEVLSITAIPPEPLKRESIKGLIDEKLPQMITQIAFLQGENSRLTKMLIVAENKIGRLEIDAKKIR